MVRWRDSDTNGTVNDTIVFTIDANMNVTSYMSASNGTVAKRFEYDPYGRPRVLSSGWALSASDPYNLEILYCGYRYDRNTGLYHVRNRYYHPTLGRWGQWDRSGHIDGLNLLQYGVSAPALVVDPSGNSIVVSEAEGMIGRGNPAYVPTVPKPPDYPKLQGDSSAAQDAFKSAVAEYIRNHPDYAKQLDDYDAKAKAATAAAQFINRVAAALGEICPCVSITTMAGGTVTYAQGGKATLRRFVARNKEGQTSAQYCDCANKNKAGCFELMEVLNGSEEMEVVYVDTYNPVGSAIYTEYTDTAGVFRRRASGRFVRWAAARGATDSAMCGGDQAYSKLAPAQKEVELRINRNAELGHELRHAYGVSNGDEKDEAQAIRAANLIYTDMCANAGLPLKGQRDSHGHLKTPANPQGKIDNPTKWPFKTPEPSPDNKCCSDEFDLLLKKGWGVP